MNDHQSALLGGRGGMNKQSNPCTVTGCKNLIHAHGWCSTHYMRWRLHGDPDYLAKEHVIVRVHGKAVQFRNIGGTWKREC